jgi:hypothetical protein
VTNALAYCSNLQINVGKSFIGTYVFETFTKKKSWILIAGFLSMSFPQQN